MINPNRISRRALTVVLLLLAMVNAGCGKREANTRPRDGSGKPVSVVTALGRVTPGRAVMQQSPAAES